MCFPNLNAIIRKKSHRENAIKGYIIKPSKTSALIKNRRKFYEEKRNGFRSGGINDCTALFTTTANAKNKGSDEKETIKFTYWGSGDEKKAIEESVDKFMEANPNIEVDLMHIHLRIS